MHVPRTRLSDMNNSRAICQIKIDYCHPRFSLSNHISLRRYSSSKLDLSQRSMVPNILLSFYINKLMTTNGKLMQDMIRKLIKS